MKKLLFVLMLLPVLGYTQKPGTLNYLDAKRGFKNIILGEDISTINADDIILVEEKSPDIAYSVTNQDILKVGNDITINNISFMTFRDKVYLISIQMDETNARRLFKVFTEAYGKPDQDNPYIDKYLWITEDVYLALEYGSLSENAAFFMDIKKYDEHAQYEKNKNQKAIDDI